MCVCREAGRWRKRAKKEKKGKKSAEIKGFEIRYLCENLGIKTAL